MKKLFYFVAMLLCFAACEEKQEPPKEEEWVIWDFVNYSVEIEVQDVETGADLLDPETEGNILDQAIVMIYKGQTIPMKSCEEITRANPAIFYGLIWHKRLDGGYFLAAGEFNTGGTVNVPFAIDWGDGTKTEFVVTSDVKNGSSKNPTIIRALTMDGVAVEHQNGANWQVTIKKEAQTSSNDENTKENNPVDDDEEEENEPTVEELFAQRAKEQMAELLERSGDYDVTRVEELLCGKDFLLWADLGYDSTWNEIIDPMYVFGEWLWVGLTVDYYRFEADGTMVWTPGRTCVSDESIDPMNGRWEFDPATRTLSILYDGKAERMDYTLIALDETTFAWDRERIYYEKDGSESFRDYLRSVYIVQ